MNYVDSYGNKRVGVLVSCKTCNKSFPTRRDRPHKFCSLECKRRKPSEQEYVQLICSWCQKGFKRYSRHLGSSKSRLYFCTRNCKDEAQKLGGIKEIQPSHYGVANGKYSYREQFKEDEFVCSRCGYNEFKVSVQIHHIDFDRDNNSKDNLIPLCANCHDALHEGLWKIEEICVI